MAAGADASRNHRERARAVRRVLLAVLGLNLVVFAAKAAYGYWSGSLAISSDAMHSLADAGSNVIGLVVLHFAEAPPDDKHPYGHRKLETVAAAAIGVTVAVAALGFAWDAIDALIMGQPAPQTSLLGFVVIGGTWLINLVVASYEGRRARDLDSSYLAADAAHTASDLVVTAGVAVSFTASFFGVGWADPVGALLIIVFVGRIAWRILSANLTVLVDKVVVDPERVREVARSIEGVEDCHRVRSRGTEGAAQVDLHLLLDGEVSLRDAHATAHRVEAELRRLMPAIVDVTIHMEPSDDPDEGL
jgi:cation diffusion facilitator family transporter